VKKSYSSKARVLWNIRPRPCNYLPD